MQLRPVVKEIGCASTAHQVAAGDRLTDWVAKPRPCSTSGACFVAGTLVHTDNGLLSIEKLRIGDMVLSRSEEKRETGYRRVVSTLVQEEQELWLIEYVLTSETEIRTLVATGSHPFWVRGAGWTSVENLNPLDQLELDGDKDNCVYKVRKILKTGTPGVGWTYDSMEDVGPFIDLRDGHVNVGRSLELDIADGPANEYLTCRVYDIEVEEFHTYYVGESGVWVYDAECHGDPPLARGEASHAP
jgi:hypothetical protein